MKKKCVTLLWSGGWDGTFRLLQLAQFDIDVELIYVVDSKRASSEFECKAMQEILKKVRERFPAKLHDIKYFEVDWILENCKNKIISEDFQYLRRKYNIGTQYEWFALLADYLKVQMETSVVHQYHGKVENAIEEEGILSAVDDDILDKRYCVLAKEDKKAAYNVFGNLIFPVIKLTKEDEERIARENDWMDIMMCSWFCHTPIKGKPCGLCSPCDDAMNTGMEWRMPQVAKIRYKFRKILYLARGIKRRLKIENGRKKR